MSKGPLYRLGVLLVWFVSFGFVLSAAGRMRVVSCFYLDPFVVMVPRLCGELRPYLTFDGIVVSLSCRAMGFPSRGI